MDDIKQGDKVQFEITGEVDRIVVSGTINHPEIVVWVKLPQSIGIPLTHISKTRV
jgi:hypothetical protein